MFPMRTNVNVSNVWQFLHIRSTSSFFAERLCRNRKNFVAGAFVNALEQMGQKCVLMAPTGRAAKVFHNYSGQKTFSIHKKFIAYKNRLLNFNSICPKIFHKNTFFVVDSFHDFQSTRDGLNFGSGYLLSRFDTLCLFRRKLFTYTFGRYAVAACYANNVAGT